MKTHHRLLLVFFLTSIVLGCGAPQNPWVMSGFLWEDNNENGRRELGEQFLGQITVNLLTSDPNGPWEIFQTEITESDGKYVFFDIPRNIYKIQIVLPDGYSFTKKYEGTLSSQGDNIYSDINPQTGLSDQIFISDDREEYRVNGGFIWTSFLVPANDPPRDSEEAPTATPLVENGSYWAFDDEEGDVVVCGAGYVNDPEADILAIDMTRIENQYSTVVGLAAPLENKYSFAVIIEVVVEVEIVEDATAEPVMKNVKRAFIYELHDGNFKIGEIDPVTGILLPEQPADVTVRLENGSVLLAFDVKSSDTVKTVFAKSFHSTGGPVHCDETDVFDLN
ncbi:MAG: hypothetical protein IH859_07970 [Chloroflexi bacterium]|nr:hypothetical protein [Chloroflexota bacterium]